MHSTHEHKYVFFNTYFTLLYPTAMWLQCYQPLQEAKVLTSPATVKVVVYTILFSPAASLLQVQLLIQPSIMVTRSPG